MYHKIAKQVFRKITVIQSVNLIISMLLSIVVARSLANIWTSFSIDNQKSVRLYLLLFTMAFLCQILLKYIFSIFINKNTIKI